MGARLLEHSDMPKAQVKKIRKQILYMLIAFEAIMAFSALGYIDIEPVSITLMTLPVLIGALYLGAPTGGLLGAIFGITSMWKATVCATSYVDEVFSPYHTGKLESLFLSVGTRILFGVIAGICFRAIKDREGHFYIKIFTISILMCALHGILVLIGLGIFFPEALKEGVESTTFSLVVNLIVTYLLPGAGIIGLDYFAYSDYMYRVFLSIREIVTSRNVWQKHRKGSFILCFVLIGVTFLLLIHVYGRICIVLESEGVEVTQDALNGILNVQLQLLISLVALFYIIYIVVVYMFEFSQSRKQEVKQLNSLLRENEQYRKTVEQALQEAENASQAKSAFISRMSHDIRTPLNAIIGLSAIGIDDSEEHPLEQSSFKKIWKSGNYLLGLVNDILDLSKIESDSVELHLEPFNIANCIDDIYIMLREQMEEKHQEFIYRCNRVQNYMVMADGMRFQQIFMNLISNSIKYTNVSGLIEVETVCEPPEENRLSVTCCVRDNGVGMSEEFMKIMFEPYSQEFAKHESVGSGLGLAIVKNLVDLMKGTIEVKSKIGYGTEYKIRFTFELAQEDSKRKEKYPKIVKNLEGMRVLLVEDNMINIEVSSILLKKRGILVEVACNGQEAVELFWEKDEHYYDAVLMDIFMPVLDGIGATKAIRNLKKEYAKTVPIIAMTANALQQDIKVALDAGMNAYLTKPIIPDRMYEELGKWIQSERI